MGKIYWLLWFTTEPHCCSTRINEQLSSKTSKGHAYHWLSSVWKLVVNQLAISLAQVYEAYRWALEEVWHTASTPHRLENSTKGPCSELANIDVLNWWSMFVTTDFWKRTQVWHMKTCNTSKIIEHKLRHQLDQRTTFCCTYLWNTDFGYERKRWCL